jgi:hypothetical protein
MTLTISAIPSLVLMSLAERLNDRRSDGGHGCSRLQRLLQQDHAQLVDDAHALGSGNEFDRRNGALGGAVPARQGFEADGLAIIQAHDGLEEHRQFALEISQAQGLFDIGVALDLCLVALGEQRDGAASLALALVERIVRMLVEGGGIDRHVRKVATPTEAAICTVAL